MNFQRLIGVLTMGAVLLTGQAMASCVSEAEARAMQVRQLHIQLQVASLNCRADDPNFPDRYADYVRRFGAQLSRNADVLKRHFTKAGGNIDRYMTRLANDEANRAHLVENYCEGQSSLLSGLTSLHPKELEHFASTAMPQNARICKGQITTKASAK